MGFGFKRKREKETTRTTSGKFGPNIIWYFLEVGILRERPSSVNSELRAVRSGPATLGVPRSRPASTAGSRPGAAAPASTAISDWVFPREAQTEKSVED